MLPALLTTQPPERSPEHPARVVGSTHNTTRQEHDHVIHT
jgi:hypothetical protein